MSHPQDNIPKSNTALVAGISVVITLVLVGGGVFAYNLGQKSNASSSSSLSSSFSSISKVATSSTPKNSSSASVLASSSSSSVASIASSSAPSSSSSTTISSSVSTNSNSSIITFTEPEIKEYNGTQFSFSYDSSMYNVASYDSLDCDAQCDPKPPSRGRVIVIQQKNVTNGPALYLTFIRTTSLGYNTNFPYCLTNDQFVSISDTLYRVRTNISDNSDSRDYVPKKDVFLDPKCKDSTKPYLYNAQVSGYLSAFPNSLYFGNYFYKDNDNRVGFQMRSSNMVNNRTVFDSIINSIYTANEAKLKNVQGHD
jgi:hypothetical protein